MSNNNVDPFSRIVPSAQLGDITNIDDKFDEEKAAISGFVPSEASTESGYDTMLRILKKQEANTVQEYPDLNKAYIDSTPKAVPQSTPVFNEVPKEESAKEEKSVEDATPAIEYKDEELLPILDSILTAGYARDTFTIRNAKIKLRTQFFWEDQFVIEKTDKLANDTTLKQSMAFYLQVYSLACNLEAMGDNVFPVKRIMTQEEQRKSFEDRVDFLLSLPTVLVNVIYTKRMEFVAKIQYIQDNFDRLIKLF